MKQLLFSKALLSAATLMVGTVALTSCSNDEFDANTNPTYDGESVKTQFAINIPVAGKSTRLGQDIVQGQMTPQFRGIGNISLIPFTGTPGTGGTPGTVINLGDIQPNELGAGTGAKVYYDVTLATGVNNFLFYGEAIASDGGEQKNGALDANISTVLNDITFSLKSIAPSESSEATTEKEALISALNNVASAENSGIKWSASTSDLRTYFESFIRLKAGSAASIKLALKDLKDGIDGATANGETGLQTEIIARIDNAIGVSGTIVDCTYPRKYKLPDGAAQIKWDDAKSAFEYIDSDNIGNLSYTDMTHFVYPASLYYWVKTPINTSKESQADKYSTDWETCLGLYENKSAAVDATTASVALVEPINYAVGRFDVSAIFKAASVTDNLGGTVDTQAEDGITLDGILIGGQKNLKWDFNTPVNSDEYTIYDASVTSTKLGISLGDVMAYSLALQTEQTKEVRFALELTNNTGTSFIGKDGTVPDGGRFYLVGKLTPDATQVNSDNRVFRQDYVTYAKVTINSLENAYNCIPDLKSPKLELGLSVDLNWEKGLVQDVTID